MAYEKSILDWIDEYIIETGKHPDSDLDEGE